MTWEERGGFMSRGAYILEIRRFLILYTVSLIRIGFDPLKQYTYAKILVMTNIGNVE